MNPMDAPPLKWGILGAGGIARAFAFAVNEHTLGSIVATGARDFERALAFAEEHGGGTAYGSYEELVADPNVEAVYVATPHSHHRDPALLAIAAGKHVLVEKAFTRNEAEALEVVNAARDAGVFCMEAMWTRHLPHIADIHAEIAAGSIGEIISIEADHGQSLAHVQRLIDPDLAGGALLDLGVYPVSFTHDFLGVPSSITAVGTLTDRGVDGQIGILFDYPGRAQAVLHTTLWAATPCVAVIAGTKGRIEIDRAFYTPTTWRLITTDGTTTEHSGVVPAGFAYEAAEVARCVAAGETESSRMPLSQTLEVMRMMDEIRAQIGVVYPGE